MSLEINCEMEDNFKVRVKQHPFTRSDKKCKDRKICEFLKRSEPIILAAH